MTFIIHLLTTLLFLGTVLGFKNEILLWNFVEGCPETSYALKVLHSFRRASRLGV